MRLETLHLRNFRGYEDETFSLHPEFNLIVGENGAGKTSFLEAAAVAMSSWLQGFPGQDSRNIRKQDVRVVRELIEKRYRELPQYPVSVEATGSLEMAHAARSTQIQQELDLRGPSPKENNSSRQIVSWHRKLNSEGGRMSTVGTDNLAQCARLMAYAVLQQQAQILPLIRYFGAGRLWESVRDFDKKTLNKYKGKQPAELAANAKEIDQHLFNTRVSEPFYGYRMSVDKRCKPDDLIRWMALERAIEMDEEEKSPALRLVYQAIESMLPEAKSARYSLKLKTFVLNYDDGQIRTFDELSDGYRNVVAIAADLAIRASMLNPQLVEEALVGTPGVVLIDELDLHLHPKWQRRIIEDLRRTFPKVQFICTTHSPQLIGQAKPDEIILLDEGSSHPGQSLGMDSNWILRHIMGSDDRDSNVALQLDTIFSLIEKANFEEAQQTVDSLRTKIGEHPELVEAQALIGRYTCFDSSATE